MTFDEYQDQALRYVNHALDLNQQMIDGAMGLCGEAGPGTLKHSPLHTLLVF